MKLHHPAAELFIPDDASTPAALSRVTHLGIGAHQDDLEFMAFHGILTCRHRDDLWFGGVTCTDGAGSSRTGPYAGMPDAALIALRHQEQNRAAILGRYAAMLQLHHTSAAIKSPGDTRLRDDLLAILTATRPEVIYTHNPADKHPTHVAVTLAAIAAMRALPPDLRPRQVIGCEVWRGLDWLADADKVIMDVSGADDFAAELNALFDSQIAGGKRYDLATLGRRSANATFLDAHLTDAATQVIYGMDLTPLVADPTLDIADHVCRHITAFQQDVRARLLS